MEKEILKLQDTIVSIATFPAQAAIGVIKISGNESLQIITKIFKSKKKKNFKKVSNYSLHYGWVIDADATIDEVIVAVMRGPHSHTREDVVEIYSHSGQFVLNKIMDLCLAQGARLADPGEFTKRAYLNGRIDLVEAEAVLDVINATTEDSLRVGVSQLEGKLSLELQQILDMMQSICVHLEADISFPEDVEIDIAPIVQDCNKALTVIKDLLRYSDKARLFREGVRCVICGKTNVGKSSLLNMLLEEERVIVTNIEGTTRDVVEESINIRGVPLKIYDTAGILRPRDLIEEKAIDRSYQKIDDADIILFVVDVSRKLNKEDRLIIDKIIGRNVLVVYNKSDLPEKVEKKELEKYGFKTVEISAKGHKGLAALEKAIVASVGKGVLPKDREVFVSNIRHIDLLKNAMNSLKITQKQLKSGVMEDLALFNAKEAYDSVATILGKGIASDVLEGVFSNFCIGK